MHVAIRHKTRKVAFIPAFLFRFFLKRKVASLFQAVMGAANLASIQYLHVRDIFPDQYLSDQVASFMTLNEAINITSAEIFFLRRGLLRFENNTLRSFR